jgi:copper transport protein
MQGAEAAGVSGFSALRESIVRETLETRFGTVWGLAVLTWIAFAFLAGLVLKPTSKEQPKPPLLALLAAPLAFIVLVPALSGHPSIQSPVALLFPANVAHVLAMAFWLGGLVALLFILPGATRRLDRADRGRLLAAVLSRFSQVALISVAVVLLTGLIQAYVYVGVPGDLLDTAYGRAVLVKFLLLLLVVAIAAYNRRRSVPRVNRIAAGGEAPGRAGVLLRRALRGEVAILLVVLGVTSALAAYAPPISVQAGPFSGDATAGPARLEMTVDPAKVGANQVHLYLFDARSGAQFTRSKEVTVTASLPEEDIGPLPLDLRPSGPGHYIAPDVALGVAGEWTLQVSVRVSAFDQYEAAIGVPIE